MGRNIVNFNMHFRLVSRLPTPRSPIRYIPFLPFGNFNIFLVFYEGIPSATTPFSETVSVSGLVYLGNEYLVSVASPFFHLEAGLALSL